MPIDESLYDQARRYAVALLAEGRTRLRDQEPSVPGALVAEVFWYIEAILPHLSRCQLESLILETDQNGANWRKYTVARARTGREALRWERWAATRRQMARQEVAADRRAKELRSSVSGNELLEIVAIQPARPATASDREVISSEIDAPIRSGWIPRKIFFTAEGLPFSAIGYSPAGWLCIDSDGSCLSDQGLLPSHASNDKADGSPMSFGRLFEVLFQAHKLLAAHNQQRCKGDAQRLERMINRHRSALWAQLRIIAAWQACHRILRRKLILGDRLKNEREAFELEFEECERSIFGFFK
ncbi:hypothetical protein [Massilia varians]|uniref:hypothetical protein n=1 Tax=Massilia varians TaxID=457921 RepID=UPI0024932365|nr:hypothetical protein [Massilia varians]